MKCNKCNKCGCLVDEYFHSYKYNGLDYCCDCMLETLVDEGVIEETSYNEEYKRLLETIEEIKSVGELVLVRENGSVSIEYNTTKGSWHSFFTNTQTIISLDYECLIGIDLNDVTIIQNEDKLIVLTPTEFKLLAVETNNKETESDYSFLSQYEDHDLLIALEEKIVKDIKEDVITEEVKLEAIKSFEDNIRKLAEKFEVEIEFY